MPRHLALRHANGCEILHRWSAGVTNCTDDFAELPYARTNDRTFDCCSAVRLCHQRNRRAIFAQVGAVPGVSAPAAIVDSATSGHDDSKRAGRAPTVLGETMSLRGREGLLRAGAALGLLVIASAQANAGGLGVREQSVYGQGSSFAGVAAGGALSSMYWNPATMTQIPGIVSETGMSGIFPFASHTPTSGILAGPPFNFPGTTNVGEAVPVLSGYTSYQFTPNLWFGLSINAPFGLSESFPDSWAGRFYGSGNELLRTYNAAPSIAWQINNWISIGAGVQIQYAKAIFEAGLPGGPGFGGLPGGLGGVGSQATLRGTGWGFGATAGVTLTSDARDHHRPWLAFGAQPKDSGRIGHKRYSAGDDNRFCAHHSRSARHCVAWNSPAARSAMDTARYGGMGELEPDRHLQHPAAQRCSGDRSWESIFTQVPVA